MSHLIKLHKLIMPMVMFAVVALGSAGAVMADSVTFNLNQPSSLPAGNYGTVKLDLVGSTIQVTITLSNGNTLIDTGQHAVGFNSSLSPDPTITLSGFSQTGYSLVTPNPGVFHMDGFGNYEYALDSIYGANNPLAAHTLVFTVNTALGFNSVFNLVSPSTGGGIASPFAVDLFCPTCTVGAQTGFVGTGSSPIPEPTSMLLLGSGLVGLGAGLRRRFKRQQ